MRATGTRHGATTQMPRQGDRQATQDTLRDHLTPWVKWISERGGLPTDQLIRKYLERDDFKLAHTSYMKIGHTIVDFSNHYLDQRDRVALIKPHGPTKEKATMAMATPVYEALGEHVMEKLQEFKPYNVKLKEENVRADLAKYLGK